MRALWPGLAMPRLAAQAVALNGHLAPLSIFDSLNSGSNAEGKVMPSSYVIGNHFESFIKSQIQQGRYASASEVMRDALRVLEDREKFRTVKLEALRADIQKGANSGEGIAADTVFSGVRERIAQLGSSQSGGR
jgi:antitoxin ParD1/3/4